MLCPVKIRACQTLEVLCMRHQSSYFVAATSIIVLVAGAAPAFADAYSDGTASYAAGNFAKAKEQFAKAIVAKPKSWQAHYQLANTYMQLKDSANAKKSYAKCLTCSPPADIKGNCVTAIAYIATNPTLAAPAAAAPRPQPYTPKYSSSAETASGSGGGDSGVEARRAAILQQGEAEIAKMREHENEKLKEAEASGNQRYLTHDGQEVMGLTREDRAAMEKEIERKAAEIRDLYKRKAQSVR